MREFKYVVTDPEGIHARPAGELVKAVKAFSSDIKIAKGGKAKEISDIRDETDKKGLKITIDLKRGTEKSEKYHNNRSTNRINSANHFISFLLGF